MKVIVDRIEGDFAVVEADETTYNLPKALCPEAKEGNTIEITVIERRPRQEESRAIFERLRKNSSRKAPLGSKPPETAGSSAENAPSGNRKNADNTAKR